MKKIPHLRDLLFVLSFSHRVVAAYLFLVMGNIVTFCFPLLIVAAVDVVFILRDGPVARHRLILHIVLTSTSFHIIDFMCDVKNSYHFSRFA
jgi:hypothetical protein